MSTSGECQRLIFFLLAAILNAILRLNHETTLNFAPFDILLSFLNTTVSCCRTFSCSFDLRQRTDPPSVIDTARIVCCRVYVTIQCPSVCLSGCPTLRRGVRRVCSRHGRLSFLSTTGGSVAEWLACCTQAQKGQPGFKSQSRRCRVTVLGKLFTPIVPLLTKQENR